MSRRKVASWSSWYTSNVVKTAHKQHNLSFARCFNQVRGTSWYFFVLHLKFAAQLNLKDARPTSLIQASLCLRPGCANFYALDVSESFWKSDKPRKVQALIRATALSRSSKRNGLTGSPSNKAARSSLLIYPTFNFRLCVRLSDRTKARLDGRGRRRAGQATSGSKDDGPKGGHG